MFKLFVDGKLIISWFDGTYGFLHEIKGIDIGLTADHLDEAAENGSCEWHCNGHIKLKYLEPKS